MLITSTTIHTDKLKDVRMFVVLRNYHERAWTINRIKTALNQLYQIAEDKDEHLGSQGVSLIGDAIQALLKVQDQQEKLLEEDWKGLAKFF